MQLPWWLGKFEEVKNGRKNVIKINYKPSRLAITYFYARAILILFWSYLKNLWRGFI